MLTKKLPSGLRESFDFNIYDDHITYGGKEVYFLRIHPKNMSILSYDEKLTEIKGFQHFLDASPLKFSMFVTDKTENLEEVSRFYKKQMELRPEYEFIFRPIVDKISSIEQTSASVQRAFYIIYKAKDRRDYEAFAKQLSGHLVFIPAEKEEFILVLRNFILREYTPFSLYVFEEAVQEHYREAKKNKRLNRKVEADPSREQREDNLDAISRLSSAMNFDDKEKPEYAESESAKTASGETGGLWPHA